MHIRRFRSVLRSTPIAVCICLALAGRALAQAADEPLSPEVLAQIAALQQEKAARTPAEQKISSRLAQDAHVTITYLLDTGETVVTSERVPAKSRLTINPEAGEDIRLKHAAFATTIASDVAIVAERSMYWSANGVFWTGGSNAGGILVP